MRDIVVINTGRQPQNNQPLELVPCVKATSLQMQMHPYSKCGGKETHLAYIPHQTHHGAVPRKTESAAPLALSK